MNDQAVAAAYRDYSGAVYARCVRLLRDRDGARDVTQEVFVRCFDCREALRPGRELLGWLYRVATNLCFNLLRDGAARRRADGDAVPPAAVGPQGPARRVLWDLLSDLDDRTRAIVVYVYLDGMTHAEAAEIAQVTDRTVRNCLTRFQEQGRLRLGSDRGLFEPGMFLGEGLG
jgi:RNA polymerase sigma-70 factor (ECF subfamily)